MELKLIAVSLRGRTAYKDDTGTLYLQCTKCKSLKPSDSFIKDKWGFQGKHSNCKNCRNEVNKRYRLRTS